MLLYLSPAIFMNLDKKLSCNAALSTGISLVLPENCFSPRKMSFTSLAEIVVPEFEMTTTSAACATWDSDKASRTAEKNLKKVDFMILDLLWLRSGWRTVRAGWGRRKQVLRFS